MRNIFTSNNHPGDFIPSIRFRFLHSLFLAPSFVSLVSGAENLVCHNLCPTSSIPTLELSGR